MHSLTNLIMLMTFTKKPDGLQNLNEYFHTMPYLNNNNNN